MHQELVRLLISKLDLFGGRGDTTALGDLSSRMRSLALDGEETLGESSKERKPMLLVLDPALQSLPWENTPGLKNERWGHSIYN